MRCQRKGMLGLMFAFAASFSLLQTAKLVTAADFDVCDGNSTIATGVCVWQQRAAPASDLVLRAGQVTPLPILILSQNTQNRPLRTGYSLTLNRLVLANVTLAAPGTADVPTLWPLGMFEATGARLNIADVRLLLTDVQFQQYLTYFQQVPEALQHYHTDGRSWLHIARLNTSNVLAHSVTLIAGPCVPNITEAFIDPGAVFAAAAAAAQGGCAVRAVDNSSLVPILLKDAAVDTQQLLLIVITTNVSLGQGLPAGAINIRRPVMMAGFSMRLTSVDFGMVVNQLNATAPNARLYWQSLVLENLAPGDAVTSLMAAPYSAAITFNVWAIYCNRSTPVPCLHLYNTTSVVATQEEMDYTTFMFSMYNSPLPAMREQVDFYDTELKFTVLQFVPGPGPNALTALNISSLTWFMVDAIFTTKPVVARKLPLPPGPSVELLPTRAGPLMQAVDSCTSLQAAAQYQTKSNRLHIWLLVNNVSLAPPDNPNCWQAQAIDYQTEMFSQPKSQSSADNHRWMHEVLIPTTDPQRAALSANSTTAEQRAAAGDTRKATGSSSPVVPGVSESLFALSFGFRTSAMHLPANAMEKFMLIQNVTLLDLPQGPGAAAGAALVDGKTAPDVWTVLLWSIDRGTGHTGSPLFLSGVQLLLPQQEYDYLANEARRASSFAVQLSDGSGLTLSGATVHDNSVFLTSMQGPGVAGTRLTLLPDPAAAKAMPNYVWPLSVAPHRSSSGGGGGTGGGSPGLWVAVGAGIGAGVCLMLLALCCFWCLRHRHRRQQQQGLAGKEAAAVALCDIPSKMERGIVHGYRDSSSEKEESLGQRMLQGMVGQTVVLHNSDASVDVNCEEDQKQHLQHCKLCDERLPTTLPRALGNTPGSSISSALYQPAAVSRSSAAISSDAAAGDSIATGLERWRAAINLTTLQMMERRMQVMTDSAQTRGSSNASNLNQSEQATQQPAQAAERGPLSRRESPNTTAVAAAAAACGGGGIAPSAAAAAAGRGMKRLGSTGNVSGASSSSTPQQPGLQLQSLIGQGSFGAVYLGTWHGKKVAVKVMQLPANALLGQHAISSSSSPHMAIMEAVVSSTMSHPNVVQVYTYMLNPLMVGDDPGSANRPHQPPAISLPGKLPQQQQYAGGGQVAQRSGLSGWELRLIMEYCDQGTLRDALDHKSLLRNTPSPYLLPALVMNLAQDVSAALLHLHSEGVVHGDLKAANVLLTKGGEDVGGVWAATLGYRVTAKVADFGLALSLDPKDTHATMAARGTPTHMSPELFLSGHVSKASDVYAFGILLYEIMTGQRAYRGVPVPLLPHEVARQGLRPTWPQDMPTGYKQMQKLAEACWAQEPQDRPSFLEIFEFLSHGKPWGGGNSGHTLSSSGTNAVEQKLQDLQHSAEILAQQVEQQQHGRQPGWQQQQQFVVVGAATAPMGLGTPGHFDLSWSEVTHGAIGGRAGGGPTAAATRGWALISQQQ